MVRDIYLLDGKDFYILLGAAGIKRIYGVNNPSFMTTDMSDQEYMIRIHGMIKEGILKAEDDRYRISDDYKVIFSTIKNADTMYAFRFSDGYKASVAAYKSGQEVVILQDNIQNPNKVKLEKTKWSEFLLYLTDNEIIPEEKKTADLSAIISDEDLKNEITMKYANQLDAAKWNFDDEEFYDGFIVVSEMYSLRSEWECVYRAGIVETSLNYCIMHCDDENVVLENYTKNRMCSLLDIDCGEKK